MIENYASLFNTYKAQAVDPTGFMNTARPGRVPPDPAICLQIECGKLTAEDVGAEYVADCTFGGFAAARTCKDPLCEPFCQMPNPTVAIQTNQITDVTGMPDVLPSPIPYSPPNSVQPMVNFGRSNLASETKRRRQYYQTEVLCPGGEQSMYQIGLDTWKGGFGAVADKLRVITLLSFEEIAGLLTPALITTGAAWLLFGTRGSGGSGKSGG